MTIAISILVFLIISILLYFGISVYVVSAETMEMRLKIVANITKRRTDTEKKLSRSFSQRIVVPVAKRFASICELFTPWAAAQLVEKRLFRAGGMAGLATNEFIAIASITAIILMFISLLVSYLLQLQVPKVIGGCIYGIVLGLFFPFFMLSRKIAYRQESIQRDLPDVLDLITISVEAGLSFDGALAKLTEKMRGTLVDEFGRVLQEMRMGVTRKEALKAMGERCGNKDLSLFVSALVQADQLGVSIGHVLRVQASGIRKKRQQQIEQKANKAPVYMLFPLITCIFPSMFIVLLGPAVLKIMAQLLK